MVNSAVIWSFAGVLAATCFARGLKMKDSSRFSELLWYSVGAFVLAGASLVWISLENEIMIQHRIVLGVIGAILGSLVMLSIAEWIHPMEAKAQTPGGMSTPTAKGVNKGKTVIDSSGGGTGADISVTGTPGATVPTVGLETNGLRVTQTGPGTGLKVTVGGDGPAIGVRSTVTDR